MRRSEKPDIRDRYPGSPLRQASCPNGKGVLCKRIVYKFESCTGLNFIFVRITVKLFGFARLGLRVGGGVSCKDISVNLLNI